MNAVIKTQRFGLGNILSEGWRIYRANFSHILLVVLCVYIPVNIILAFIPITVLTENYGWNGIRLYYNIIQALEFFIGTIATMAIAYIVENAIQGQNIVWQVSLQQGLSRWASAIGTGLLAGIIILGLTLALIIPGLIWTGYYSFWVYIVALRKIGGKAALDYSKNLVKGQWWRVFGIQLVIGILGSIVSLVITLPFTLVSDNQILGIVSNTISDIAGAPFTVMALVFFLNTDYLKNSSQAEQSISPIAITETHA